MKRSFRTVLVACVLAAAVHPPAAAAQLVYDTVHSEEAAADIAAVLRTHNGQDLLEVAVLVRTGSHEVLAAAPERLCLIADGELILPAQYSKISFDRAALGERASEDLFTSIGEEYRLASRQAAALPGRRVDVDEKGLTSEAAVKSSSGSAVDSVAVAAGEGLLAAQRTGEVAGARTTFDLAGLSPEVMVLKFEIASADTSAKSDVTVLLPFKIVPQPAKSLYVDGAPPAPETAAAATAAQEGIPAAPPPQPA